MLNGEMLAAYIVAAKDHEASTEHLKATLADKLPAYMVPGLHLAQRGAASAERQ